LFASSSFVLLSGLVNIYGVEASAAAGAAAKVQTLANLPSQGFWGKIRNWLREEDEEDDDAVTSMTENQRSIFWTD